MLKTRQVEGNTGVARSTSELEEWRPPGGYDDVDVWALANREALEQYARRNEKDGTAAEQLDRFLAEHPDMLTAGHAEI